MPYQNLFIVAQKQPDSQTLSYITKIIHSAAGTADEETIEVTFVVILIITTTMIPNTIMDDANIKETKEAVVTGVESNQLYIGKLTTPFRYSTVENARVYTVNLSQSIFLSFNHVATGK